MFLGDITQGARRTEVGNGVAFHMVEDVVGHGHERILLSIHLTVLLDKRQSVYIGVNNHAKIVASLGTLTHDAAKVLGDRFGVVREIAVGLAVEERCLDTERLEQVGQYLSAY